MDPSAFMALAERCAPGAPLQSLTEIVRVASGFEPLSLNLEGRKPIKILATTKGEAIALAAQAKISGQGARIGLAGLSLTDLDKTGLTLSDAFTPCRALGAAAELLARDPKAFAKPKMVSVAPVRTTPPDAPDSGDEISQQKFGDPAASKAEKPWDVFGHASTSSLLVYDMPALRNR